MVNDEGAVESVTAAMLALLLLVAMMFVTGLSLTTQYQRAVTAADLAALAAAGTVEPCRAAESVVTRNGGLLERCEIGAGVAEVLVSMPTGMQSLLLPRQVTVAARAGLPDGPESALQ